MAKNKIDMAADKVKKGDAIVGKQIKDGVKRVKDKIRKGKMK